MRLIRFERYVLFPFYNIYNIICVFYDYKMCVYTFVLLNLHGVSTCETCVLRNVRTGRLYRETTDANVCNFVKSSYNLISFSFNMFYIASKF